jgi:cell division protein FtsW
MNRDAKIVFLAVSILVMLGIVMIYSSSAVYAYQRYGDSMYLVKRHILFLLMGLAAAIACMTIPAKAIADNSRWIMLVAIVLLVVVLLPGIGTQAGGARRWMRFFGLGFQPSELAKLALIIYLADFTSRKRYVMVDLKYGFIPPVFVMGLVSSLVLIEPDMGTAVAILFIGFVMLFVSGSRLRHLGTIILSVLPALVVAIAVKPYRMKRIVIFLHPWQDKKGAGFQLIQSFIALGSGGLIGVGLGQSKQKLFYLPESHTDFIFSIIGEELGFLGAASVLIVFISLIWFSLRIALKIKEQFASRVVMGISVMIAFETIVNIGVSTGALPTKGLPLPFISYGGSSLFFHLVAIGLLLNMARLAES